MKFSAISFDLQGTLSPISFSEEFWSEVLPTLYSKNQNISLGEAKKLLRNKSNMFDLYDYRYYSVKFWLKNLGINISVREALSTIFSEGELYKEFIPFLEQLNAQVNLLIISSACKEFIDLELGVYKNLFQHTYSSVDDFGIGGKPPVLYTRICRKLDISPNKILHVGDDYEMDIKNAKNAGLKTFYFNRETPRRNLVKSLERYLKNE